MDGSKLVVPKGWTHERITSQSERWNDPSTGNHIQLDTIPWDTNDPVKHWVVFGRTAPDNLPGFTWLSQPESSTVRGWDGADAHYTWYRNRVKMHADDRGFTVNGRQYSLLAAVREQDYAAYPNYLNLVYASFQPPTA